ncbi:CotS family spore coat protein [uncultured Clostridium sp.]|uniref:CotS family spore coat protein n=1 Tax=uncultured Clostridium sp. TaxID=59620 RepID=UPI002623B3BD|nr:CotS family spore coat protein [uncultured Clostridium sp.]
MDFEMVKRLVQDNYRITVSKISKKKNVYKVTAGFREYCLKVIKYEFDHFNFIVSAIKHLEKSGFKNTPKIIRNKNHKDYIKFDDCYAYLTEWMDVKEVSYENDDELLKTAKKVKELHSFSKGFVLNESMKPRVGWGTWDTVFETRISEILDFKKRIGQKAQKSKFDELYLSVIDEEVKKGEEAILKIRESNYIDYMNKEVMNLSFCHHDLAHHNILIGNDEEVNIIDFDYCILDSHLHDLASLCMRAMRNGNWEIEKYELITDAYGEVTKEEEKIMLGFLKFPQDFWQVGLQYYWEQLSWSEERFLGRLTNYISDRENRNDFLIALEERSK